MWRSRYSGLLVYGALLLVAGITCILIAVIGSAMSPEPVATAVLMTPLWLASIGCFIGAEVIFAYRSIAMHTAECSDFLETIRDSCSELLSLVQYAHEQQNRVGSSMLESQRGIRDDLAVQHATTRQLLLEQCQYLSEIAQGGEES